MSNFSFGGLLPGWLELIVFIYWTFTIILLIMDDREPSITLAWLFILIFLPLIGVFFYIFFGRDWKVVAQRKGWIQTLKRVETEEMAPIYERNAGAGERFEREWAGTIAVPVSRATVWRPGSRCASCTTGWAASRSRSASSSSSPRRAPRCAPTSPTWRASTTATTARSWSSTARSATPAA